MNSFYYHKKVWITGASSGIGRSIALRLALFQSEIYLSSENEKDLMSVAEQCRELGATVKTMVLDQSNPEAVDKAADLMIADKFIPDVLILNAGISQRDGVVDTKLEVHDRIMQINFRSSVQITKKLLPHMISAGGGHIGVTSSISGKFGFPLRSSYAAAKHAIHGFFESAGIEYRKKGIYVTILCPGRVKTNISINALHGDGRGYGKMDAGQAGGITPERCAKKYLRAIQHKRREKLIGGKELLMARFKQYTPWLFYYLSDKIKSS